MELELEQEELSGYEPVLDTTVCQEETMESIVPDACPDILRIVQCCGQTTIQSRISGEGSAVVKGTVHVWVLYQPESGRGLCRVEADVPFTCQTQAEALNGTGTVFACSQIRQAEARTLNPRKILIRVNIETELMVYQPVQIWLSGAVIDTGEQGVCQKQHQEIQYNLSSVQDLVFPVEEQISLQTAADAVPTLLSAQIQTDHAECKVIGNRLIVKGTLQLDLMLQEEEQLRRHTASIPYSQVMELDSGEGDRDCVLRVQPVHVRYESDPSGAPYLNVSLELAAQALVYTKQPIELLQDLYSTKFCTQCSTRMMRLCQPGSQTVLTQMVREILDTECALHSVLNYHGHITGLKQCRQGNDLVLQAELLLSALYLDETDAVQAAETLTSVEARLPCPEGTRCHCTCSCPEELYAAPAAGGIEVRLPLEFHCLTYLPAEVCVICDAQLGEPRDGTSEQRPSVVMRLAAPGEKLWDIAKYYGTTTEQILSANGLEDDALPDGAMLLIPSR